MMARILVVEDEPYIALGLKSDLVILNGEASEYDRPLQQQLIRLIQIHAAMTGMDQPGGVFLRSTAQLSSEELTLFLSAAHVVFFASRGTLASQLARSPDSGRYPPVVKTAGAVLREPGSSIQVPELAFENGISNLWGPSNLWLAPWSSKAPNVSLVPMTLPNGRCWPKFCKNY